MLILYLPLSILLYQSHHPLQSPDPNLGTGKLGWEQEEERQHCRKGVGGRAGGR